MKIKTAELVDPALIWLVATCEGYTDLRRNPHRFNDDLIMTPPRAACGPILFVDLAYSADWAQGGPIIEREIFKLFKNVGGAFTAQIKKRVPYYSPTYDADIGTSEVISCSGPTPLIAAMRCYVASKLGDEVDIPDQMCEILGLTSEKERSSSKKPGFR